MKKKVINFRKNKFCQKLNHFLPKIHIFFFACLVAKIFSKTCEQLLSIESIHDWQKESADPSCRQLTRMKDELNMLHTNLVILENSESNTLLNPFLAFGQKYIACRNDCFEIKKDLRQEETKENKETLPSNKEY